jgi:hypothetical protein
MTHYGSTSRRPAAAPIWHLHLPHLGTCSRHLLNLRASEPFHLVDPIQTHISPHQPVAPHVSQRQLPPARLSWPKSRKVFANHSPITRSIVVLMAIRRMPYKPLMLYDVLDLLLSEV